RQCQVSSGEAVGGDLRTESGGGQALRDEGGDPLFVLDHENALHFCPFGRIMRNCAPMEVWSRTTLPPCASAMAEMIDSPSPKPAPSVEPRQKRSKMSSAISSGTPSPSSRTQMCTDSASSRAPNTIT